MNHTLYTKNQYGVIEINLKKLMDEQHITRNALARAINARFEVVNKWYQGNVEKIDADVLARICYVLDCTPADIVIYVKPKEK